MIDNILAGEDSPLERNSPAEWATIKPLQTANELTCGINHKGHRDHKEGIWILCVPCEKGLLTGDNGE